MPARITFIPEDDRLDVSFEGNLDVTVWQTVCDACRRPQPHLKACIVDLTAVGREFDSGIAVLGLLCQRMRVLGTTVVFLCDDPKLKSVSQRLLLPCGIGLSGSPKIPKALRSPS